MKIADLVKAAVDADCEYQFLHECGVGAKMVKAKKGAPAHNRIEFCTQVNYTPKSLLIPSSAEYVGMILWIPSETYKRLTTR